MGADHNVRMERWLATSIAAMLGLAPWLSSRAADTVVYRCSSDAGAVSLQDTPCAPQQTEQRRVMRRPVELATPEPLPIAPAPGPPPQQSPPEPVARRDPQPLYDCRRHDGSVYESQSGIPERRWVPLWVVGLDPRAPPRLFGEVGRSPPKAPRSGPGLTTAMPGAGNAYGAGVWVEDQCYRLPPQEICARRREHLAELGRRIFNGQQRERDRLRVEQRGLRAQLREECG
jgi:hypothetical protein